MRLSIVLGIAVVVLIVAGLWLWTPDKSRAFLEQRYSNGPADFTEVEGVRLHLRDTGPKQAPAVILIHGFGASLHTWEPWAKVLASDHRVIRFDLPGSGLSAPDPTGDYTDARSMRLLVAIMDKLGVTKATVVGHSIGGRMAWTFAATHPDRVDRLVLISPDGYASAGFEYGKTPEVPMTVRMMRYVLPRPLLRMSLEPAYADPSVMTDELATRYYELMLAPGSRDALIARLQQTVLVDPLPLLRRIQAPTLLLWGEKDAMIPFANSADYLNAIPDVRLVPFPGVGHLPQEEATGPALDALRAFLAGGEGTAAPRSL